MSEKEKKRRQCYKKNREKWIFTQAVIIIVVAVAILISSLVYHQMQSKYYIGYSERGNVDYNVFLKDNEFYDTDHLGEGQSYVASLIDKIIADFNYEIDMDTDDVNYRYSYTIKSRLEIIDNSSKVAIFNPEYELVKVQNKTQSSSNRLTINEIIVINYDEYNNLASRFLATYDLNNTTSSIVVTLDVDVLSDCTAFSGSNTDSYTSELRIPLTTQTVNIKMTSAVPDAEMKMIACTRGAGSEAYKTTAIVLTVIDVILILVLVAFIYLTRTEDITYTAKVKKILSQYKSYIQRINNLFDTSSYQIIMVDTFDEMLEIRDTIQAPILMHENADKTCAKFIIPTDSKLLYLFQIKIEGYSEPEVEKKPDPTPTTIVKPNITNVVRPVVKVVLTPQTPDAEINTVIEDPEVEVEEEADITVSAEAEVLEDAEEVFEPISDEFIEEFADETVDDRIDAIDVAWPESKDSGKTYRYDPDGNDVEDGDVVLVPTRDIASDKDVVREAEVVKGNYKIDATSLEHPLKKIIGVVKRRAEKVFSAMITPEDDET